MATADDIQALVNAVTVAVNELESVDWNAYAVEGPGMNKAVELARSMLTQSGMLVFIAVSIMDPIQVFAAAIEEGMTG